MKIVNVLCLIYWCYALLDVGVIRKGKCTMIKDYAVVGSMLAILFFFEKVFLL